MKKILIVGGSGLIGSELLKGLSDSGYDCSILSRNPNLKSIYKTYSWNPYKNFIDPKALSEKAIIINLAGASLADHLWTKKRKLLIYNSRIKSTSFLMDQINQLPQRPEKVINASAIGYYGDNNNPLLCENAPPGNDFLSKTCLDWENAAKTLHPSIKLIIARIPLVFSSKGGSFPVFKLQIRCRLSVLFGSGTQKFSWIHVNDLIKVFKLLLEESILEGVFNACTPTPVSYKELNSCLMKSMNIKCLPVKIPKKLVAIALGDMSELFLSNQSISPCKLLKSNFEFSYPDIKSAIHSILKEGAVIR